MILPIIAYGHPVLRKKCEEITVDYPQLSDLIANMYETMSNASGVGLAAPQIGLPIRLFVVDMSPFAENDGLSVDEQKYFSKYKKVLINPTIIEETGEPWTYNEGCLSIPNIHEDVDRLLSIRITYYDEKFKSHTEQLQGIAARVIQHEYDHIEGVLFIDKISSFRKKLIKSKLTKITKGKSDADYQLTYYKQ